MIPYDPEAVTTLRWCSSLFMVEIDVTPLKSSQSFVLEFVVISGRRAIKPLTRRPHRCRCCKHRAKDVQRFDSTFLILNVRVGVG